MLSRMIPHLRARRICFSPPPSPTRLPLTKKCTRCFHASHPKHPRPSPRPLPSALPARRTAPRHRVPKQDELAQNRWTCSRTADDASNGNRGLEWRQKARPRHGRWEQPRGLGAPRETGASPSSGRLSPLETENHICGPGSCECERCPSGHIATGLRFASGGVEPLNSESPRGV